MLIASDNAYNHMTYVDRRVVEQLAGLAEDHLEEEPLLDHLGEQHQEGREVEDL